MVGVISFTETPALAVSHRTASASVILGASRPTALATIRASSTVFGVNGFSVMTVSMTFGTPNVTSFVARGITVTPGTNFVTGPR